MTAEVGLVKDGDVFGLVADLAVGRRRARPGRRRALVEQAHQVCPYSNATRGNVEVRLRTTVGPVAA